MRKMAIVLLVPLALSGCAGLSDAARSMFQEPKLSFRAASLEALDLEGATIGFRFDLENPNGFGLDLARVGYGVEVEGTRVVTGDLPGGLKIPAKGVAPLSFPVRVRFQDVPGIVSIIRSGKEAVRYRLAGNVGVRTPLGVLDLPLSHEDSVRLPSLPRFGVDGLAVRSVSLAEVAFDVRLRVENPNRFPLPMGRLDYALAISGSPVASAQGAAMAAVAGSSSAVVTIPVRVSVAGAGRAATDLMRGGTVPVKLTGVAELAGLALPLDLQGSVPARR